MKTSPSCRLLLAPGLGLLLFASLPALKAQTLPAGSLRSTKPDDYRQFALLHDGDVERGRRLFLDEHGVSCAKCHSVDSRGDKVGPDLFALGDRFSRREVIDAILLPSAAIAVGYGTTQVETRSLGDYQGVLKQASASGIQLALGDGRRVAIPAHEISGQHGSTTSLMPEGLHSQLSLQEFTDLTEYLMTLKEARQFSTRRRGMPDLIPPLAVPVELRPFLAQELRVPGQRDAAPGVNPSGLVWFAQIPGFPDRFLALHQTGVMWFIEKSGTMEHRSIFADLTPKVFSARGPNGLLGLAFHPRFSTNRKYYLKYQVVDEGRIATVVDERTMADDLRSPSSQPERRILTIPSGAEHHNGGCLTFGPDGMLYVGMGDSAPNFDPNGHSQDLRLLLGKMLRIDVDHPTQERPYGIPSNNPFRHRPDARPEIWAYGFREPWRFSFDRVTGELWMGDLGQERGDEVEIVRRGGNYGWNAYEGFELFSQTNRQAGKKYLPPLFSTRRNQGSCLIGGTVYRGDPRSSFYGVYIFGDHQSKHVWGLTRNHGSLGTVRELATAPQSITAIVPDERDNLYVVGYQGMVYRIDFQGAHFTDSLRVATHAR